VDRWWKRRGGGGRGGTNGQEDRTTKSQYPTQPNRSFLASTATSTYLVVNGFVGVLCSKTNADKQQQAHEKQRRGKYFQSFRTFTFDGHHPKDIDHEHHDAPDNRKNEWSRQSWKERRERTGEENEKEERIKKQKKRRSVVATHCPQHKKELCNKKEAQQQQTSSTDEHVPKSLAPLN